ncbi:unnamed protein product [Protopolystoma xenopodis]|uniref:Uncharacterized protein n=1 Tax=Protopolystoma xenopodis TaxID=117903 RepID=A0A3S5CFC7_9PLAT|nr:unnamed protein product [Protopolystoma xenopodis]
MTDPQRVVVRRRSNPTVGDFHAQLQLRSSHRKRRFEVRFGTAVRSIHKLLKPLPPKGRRVLPFEYTLNWPKPGSDHETEPTLRRFTGIS